MKLNNINDIFLEFKKNQKQLAMVISIAVLLAALLYLNYSLRPQIAGLIGIEERLRKTRSDIKAAESDITKMGSMRDAVDAYNKKIGEYENMLPTEDRIPALLENLSEMAKNANMNIVSIMPIGKGPTRPEAHACREIPIMITAKAGYHELGRFLSALEHSGRFMKVTDLQIKGNKAIPKKHDVELSVVTYVLLEGR